MTHFDSLCAREQEDLRTTTPHILPLYLTSSFVFDDIDQGIRIFNKEEAGHVYSRYGNPTTGVVAQKIADLESYGTGSKAYGVMCSSGMAAIHLLTLSLLKAGDAILTQGDLYGGTTELFTKITARCGVVTHLTDLTDLHRVRQILSENPAIRMVFVETPANPTMQCVDLEAICTIAHAHDAIVAVDNTLATPYLQRPLAHGVDFVMHSTTKYLNGHGNAIAGVLIGKDETLMRSRVWETMKLTGCNASPMDAWLVHQGMKTLSLRVDRHCSNARALAGFLHAHPRVNRVNYAGLKSHTSHGIATKQMSGYGGLLSFEMEGGFQAALMAMRRIRFCTLAPTFGDLDTLILHPASMSHINIPKAEREQCGITDGLIRVSVGIEHIDDIIADIDQAISG